VSGAGKTPPTATKTTRYDELREAFRGLGLSEKGASIAARGREADVIDPANDYERVGPSPSQQGYKSGDYAVVLNPADDATWFFRLVDPSGNPLLANIQSAIRDLFAAGGESTTPAGFGASLSPTLIADAKKKLSASWDLAVKSVQFPPAKPAAIK
jgi:hypothetical protein